MDEPDDGPVGRTVEDVFRTEWARVVAALVAFCGELDLAEEAAQDAFAAAAGRWPVDGVPDVPRAWLTTTARRRVIDRMRREKRLAAKLRELERAQESAMTGTTPPVIPDERLELIFLCCHPALAPQARVALVLRAVGGLDTAEIARAFLVSEETMKRRLTRARPHVREAGILNVGLDEETNAAVVAAAEGRALVRRAVALGARGAYALQAAIAELQTEDPIDWPSVVELYDALLRETGSPVVALNRAVAVAETEGPAAALAVVEDLDLAEYRYLHSTRAELLRRLGDVPAARDAYDRALTLTATEAERRFLRRRRSELSDPPSP